MRKKNYQASILLLFCNQNWSTQFKIFLFC